MIFLSTFLILGIRLHVILLISHLTLQASNLRFDGFSSDGQFAAFTETDSNWSQKTYLDVPGNKYCTDPVKTIGKNSLMQLDSIVSKYDDSIGIIQGDYRINLTANTSYDTCKFINNIGRAFYLNLKHSPKKGISLIVMDSLSMRWIVLQEDIKIPLWRKNATGYEIKEVQLCNNRLFAIMLKVIFPSSSRYMAITGQLPTLPILQDTVILSIIEKLNLFIVQNENEPWWAGHNRTFILDSYERSLDTQLIVLRPKKFRNDHTWTFSIQRRDYPTYNEAIKTKDYILSTIDHRFMTAPRFAWCWVSAIFSRHQIYVVSTWCSGSQAQHFNVTDILFNQVSQPVDGIYGVIGFHSGGVKVIRKLPEIAQ